jgi:hypothetical protein
MPWDNLSAEIAEEFEPFYTQDEALYDLRLQERLDWNRARDAARKRTGRARYGRPSRAVERKDPTTCAICLTPFFPKPKGPHGKYCSGKCQNRNRQMRKTAKKQAARAAVRLALLPTT